MTGKAVKRFWKRATDCAVQGGHTVKLDDKAIRTPAKSSLLVPSRALARAIAEEWNSQAERVEPATMPITRLANSAIDKVAPQQSQVADMIAAYADADLLCYRAPDPPVLAQRQAECWDPYLDWAGEVLGARLRIFSGVVHMPQERAALARFSELVHQFKPFELTALHDVVTLSGSLVLGLAALHRFKDVSQVWEASRIDETWQIEQWGEDELAKSRADQNFDAFCDACRFYFLNAEKS